MRMLGSGLVVKMFGDEAECCEGACENVDVHPGRRDAERRQKRKADGVFTGRLLRVA